MENRWDFEGYLLSLRGLPFVRRAELVSAGKGRDARGARLRLQAPDREFLLPVEFHAGRLGRDSAQLLIHRSEGNLMVFTPVVGLELGDLLEQAGINFVDLAGNCHLRLDGRYVARIQGRRGHAAKATAGSRGLRAPAYRVLFAFLTNREWIDAPARAVASASGVSPQTANELRNWLLEKGLLIAARGQRHWAPGRKKEALTLWLSGYSTSLAPNLLIGRFRAREKAPDELERRLESDLDPICEWRYGGGAAAMQLTGFYRGDLTTVYVRQAPPSLARRLHLIADAQGPLILANSAGDASFVSPDPRCVHPLLAYADLLAEGNDRANEAAAEVYERCLADEFRS